MKENSNKITQWRVNNLFRLQDLIIKKMNTETLIL